jgi:hypothetical protein
LVKDENRHVFACPKSILSKSWNCFHKSLNIHRNYASGECEITKESKLKWTILSLFF